MAKQFGINWQPIFEKYKGKWVALRDNETTVVVSGTSAKSVFTQAKKLGVEIPIMFKVPKTSLPHVGQFGS